MLSEQIVEIPTSRRLRLDIEVPPEIPTGSTARLELAWFPQKEVVSDAGQPTVTNRTPISRYFGILSPGTYGDGVAYQRKLRDEWND